MVKTRQLLWTLLICSTLATTLAPAQSTLTQIRDTVVNSDGTSFNGTVTITWNGFTGPSGGTATPLSTSARIYNGALSVLLVPTTTASAGTFYQATYNSNNGLVTWTETWQVPPSTTALTLSAVRTSTTQSSGGSSGGGTGSSGSGSSGTGGIQYATLPISISQVTSLSADLASINGSVAALASQVTSLSAAVNSTGAGTTTASFSDAEVPGGVLNGSNATFNLAQNPTPLSSLSLYRNGLLQSVGIDYTLSGTVVTFLPASVPKSTDTIAAYYRVPGTAPLATFTDNEIPAGTIDGLNVAFTLAAAPSPAASLKIYKNGVLLVQGADYTLSGSNITFASTNVTPQVGDALLANYRH